MPKRIYSEKDDEIYCYKAGGNWMFRHADTEISLDTADEERAIKNKLYLKESMSFYGAAAFKHRIKDLYPRYLKDRQIDVDKGEIRQSYFDRCLVWPWEKYLEKKLGNKRVAEMDQKTWDQFCRSCPTVREFNVHRNAIRSFLTWCVANRFLRAAPRIENPKHTPRKRKIIPPEHLYLIFQNAHGGLLLFLAFILFHGNRRGEVVKAKWKNIDLEASKMFLEKLDVKTKSSIREFPLNQIVVRLLTQRLHEFQKTGLVTKWVFPNRADKNRHMSESGFKTSWKSCIKRSKLSEFGYTWHDFRATYEKWSHLADGYTDTQKEKMVGATMDVQKRLYVSMNADDLRGLENVVNVPDLTKLLENKADALMSTTGDGRE